VTDSVLWVLTPSIIWGGVLSWVDCRERRLPNWLTLGGAAVALTGRIGYGGLPLFLDGFAAAAAAGLFLLIPFLLRGAGGGDVKMLFAAGAIAGWSRLLMMLWFTSLAGIVLGVVMILARRLDTRRLKHYARCLFDWRYDRKAGAESLPPRESEKARIPFSIPIVAGLVIAMLFY